MIRQLEINRTIRKVLAMDVQMAKQTEEAATKQHKALQGIMSVGCELVLRGYITQDPGMLDELNNVRVLASSGISYPVLIHGPSGTGKELIARALHGSRTGKFIAVNCTALPAELLESELFGHKKGAFTGAIDDRMGKFQAASNGTLFLDEIGDMDMNMQTKLLRVLQEKCITPLGSNEEIPLLNVRVVSATNMKVLTDCIRNDLLARLKVGYIATTAMIHRSADLRLLLEHFDERSVIENIEEVCEQWVYDGTNVRQVQAYVQQAELNALKPAFNT